MLTYLNKSASRVFFRWIDKRSPRARLVKLNRHNLYIFPNLNGAFFLLITLVIWMLGTNYQNNLILAVSYFLISIFIVAIHHTYGNLAGIQIRFIDAKPAFAGDPVTFLFEVQSTRKLGCENVQLGWSAKHLQTFRLKTNEPQICALQLPSETRGYLKAKRLYLTSSFPLGIIRCWTWLNLDAVALVYPQPIAIAEPKYLADNGDEEGGELAQNGDDFSGLRDYRPGDSIKQIAWKQYAQEKGIFTKEYQGNFTAEKWLDWQSVDLPQEIKLSGFCYWALEYERRHLAYGVTLPGLELDPNVGNYHLTQMLEMLATFGIKENKNDH
jgi:uncharacterized protein (DUF58 family)